MALPGPIYHRYFVGWTGNKIVVWDDDQAAKSFLLPIDSEGDAVFGQPNWAMAEIRVTDEF